MEKQEHVRVTWMAHVPKASLGLKLLLLINDWKKLSSEEKQMEKAEQKCCADAITMVLAEFLVWPPPPLFRIKQICKYWQERQQHPLEGSLQRRTTLVEGCCSLLLPDPPVIPGLIPSPVRI